MDSVFDDHEVDLNGLDAFLHSIGNITLYTCWSKNLNVTACTYSKN